MSEEGPRGTRTVQGWVVEYGGGPEGPLASAKERRPLAALVS